MWVCCCHPTLSLHVYHLLLSPATQVEASQSMIRIVGLSATLPNFRDVGAFLRVNPSSGLFHFDATYRYTAWA